jgi:hypothetical protein
VAKKNRQLNTEQKKLQQQLESYVRQSIDHEENMHTVLQWLEVVKK